MQVADKRNLVFCYVFEVKKLGFFSSRSECFYLRRYDERSRDHQSCSCCDIFLTFSFLEDFKSK